MRPSLQLKMFALSRRPFCAVSSFLIHTAKLRIFKSLSYLESKCKPRRSKVWLSFFDSCRWCFLSSLWRPHTLGFSQDALAWCTMVALVQPKPPFVLVCPEHLAKFKPFKTLRDFCSSGFLHFPSQIYAGMTSCSMLRFWCWILTNADLRPGSSSQY